MKKKLDTTAVKNPAHYSGLVIEPIEFVMANRLGFCEGNVVKYVSRWKQKGGIEDLVKAKRYLEFLIKDLEGGYSRKELSERKQSDE